MQIVYPDDRDHMVKCLSHSLETSEPYEVEQRMRRSDRTYRWRRRLDRPTNDPTGRATGWYGATIGIGDQKAAGEAPRSEQQLRLLIDTIPALVWCATPNGAPSYLNKRMVDYTGMTLDSSDLFDGGSRPSLTRQAIIHPD